MATTIQNLHSLTAGNQPGDLMPGEIAYNLADGFVYLGNGSNAYTDTLGQQIGTPTQDGMGWQQAIFNAAPIPGAVTLAGTYDAQTNEVTSVTAAGLAAGFTENAALPASAAGNADYYVIVQIGGTLTPPAPTGDADPGDWIVSTGNGWALVQNSNVTVPATNVTINPTGDFTGPSMQDVLNQIQLLYVTIADGSMSQLQCNGDANVFGSTTLGDTDSDDLTVNATSAFAAPVAMAGTLNVTGAVQAGNLYTTGNLTTTMNLTVQGNATLGNSATNTVANAGPATLGTNLTVAGVTRLNGSTQINGSLTTTNTVALTGTGGVTLSTPFNTTGSIDVSIGGSADLSINSTNINFYGGSITNWRGQLNLTQGIGNTTVTYARPMQASSGAIIQGNLNNFLVIPGTIISYGGVGVPAGYLACDGSSVSKSDYADLYLAIGDRWGTGTTNSFVLPDLRGLFLRGSGTNGTIKRSGDSAFVNGGNVGQRGADSLGKHKHYLLDQDGKRMSNDYGNTYDTFKGGGGSALSVNGNVRFGYVWTEDTGGTETSPVNATVQYLIKF